ncbi:MAG: hypothetical protein ACR2QL_05245 [Woeseiaceae bacterium]
MFPGSKAAITACLIALPLLVAGFDISLFPTICLLVGLLIWLWLHSLSRLLRRDDGPSLVLDTISMSHFAEKARWCLDRLGLDYHENKSNGLLGVIFTGRTVPRLRFRSGVVESSIGHSPEILRFLWGEYSARSGQAAAFLEPTPEALELEKKIDRYGADLQVWVYYHVLPHRGLTLRLWGAEDPDVPWWQRKLAQPLFPLMAAFLRRTFRIDGAHYAKAVEHVDKMLADVEQRLQDGRSYLLSADTLGYVDITFAAISGLWQQPPNYGGGQAEDCRVPFERLPEAARADIERWRKSYPLASEFIERLYAEERLK